MKARLIGQVFGQVLLMATVGATAPAWAQEGIEADQDGVQGTQNEQGTQTQYVTAQEAETRSGQVFDEAVGTGEEMSFEQFSEIFQGGEVVSAPEDTASEVEIAWGEADTDESGSLSRDEWMQWRQQRFEQAAGDEGRIEAGRYESLYRSTMSGVDSGGEASPNAAATGNGAGAEDAAADNGSPSPAADRGTAGGGALLSDDADTADPEAAAGSDAQPDSSDPGDSGTGATSGGANR